MLLGGASTYPIASRPSEPNGNMMLLCQSPHCESLGRGCLSPWLCSGGTSLPGGLCGNTAGAAAKSAPLPGVPLLFVCCSSFRHPKALI